MTRKALIAIGIFLASGIVCLLMMSSIRKEEPPTSVELVEKLMSAKLMSVPDEYKEDYRQFTDLLEKVPRSLPTKEWVSFNESVEDGFEIQLTIYHPSNWSGWNFHWHKYLCREEYKIRFPHGVCVHVDEGGAHFGCPWLMDYDALTMDLNLTMEEAVNQTLELAKPNMEWIGVKGISEIRTLLSNRTGYPTWHVDIFYDQLYVRPDGGRWIEGYQATIRADTGEALMHQEMGCYGNEVKS